MKAGEHGPDVLYDKFLVAKMKNVYGDGDELIVLEQDRINPPGGEFVFVLRPETDDQAAIAALWTYAVVCEATYPGLALDIREQLTRIVGDEG